jgi:hypothetical protein
MKRIVAMTSVLTAALCGAAYAQNVPQDRPDEKQQEGVPATSETTKDAPPNNGSLPPPRSDNDPQPEVATPGTPPGGFVEQAGVGGSVGYGRAGVLELGGAAGFTSGGGFTQVNVAPSVGWFLADNLEMTAMLDLAHASTDNGDGTIVTGLVEPSYHLPFDRTKFAFLGVGIGAAYVKGPGMALALAPRLGGNFLIGRSGILTPSISWQYNTHDTEDTQMGTLLVVSSAVRANIGYTVMW